MGHVCDVEDVHEAEVAADVDDVGHGALVALAQLNGTPPVDAAVDVDAQGWHTEGEEIDEGQHPELEHPGEETQVGEAQQDEGSDRRIVRRAEDRREDACYE